MNNFQTNPNGTIYYYVDIDTNREKGITLVEQIHWLVENGFKYYEIKHIKTFSGGRDGKQYNRWRFIDETSAMAFKLRWEE